MHLYLSEQPIVRGTPKRGLRLGLRHPVPATTGLHGSAGWEEILGALSLGSRSGCPHQMGPSIRAWCIGMYIYVYIQREGEREREREREREKERQREAPCCSGHPYPEGFRLKKSRGQAVQGVLEF